MQTRFNSAQLRDPEIAESERILRKCVHCGFCSATCPTYVLLGDELDSPRGRIYLIKDMLENDRPATADVARHVDRCLSCLACMTTCPSGVNYQHLIDHAREYIERTYRRPWAERGLRGFLARVVPYPARLRAAISAARLVSGAARALPGGMRVLERVLPAQWRSLLALASYRPSRRSELNTRSAERVSARKGRIALIAGCAQSVLTPSAQAASVRVLERAGFEVVVVGGCCGALVHHLGRTDHSHALAARLMRRLEAERAGRGLDAVIVTASGCGTHMKSYAYVFREDATLEPMAASTAAMTRDITEWLDQRRRHSGEASVDAAGRRGTAQMPDGAAHVGLHVAYHSACSLQHGQGLVGIPERLLSQAGFVVEEIAEGHLCCGSAGTYNVLQPQIAGRLRERKLANIRRTGACVVATGNVGCMVQLAGAADLQVVHTVELLDWAEGGPAPVSVDARNGSIRRPRSVAQ